MKQAIEQTLRGHRIIPVVEIDDAEHAVALSEALLAGGISVIEITLRTPAGVRAIERIARDVPDILVAKGIISECRCHRDIATVACARDRSVGDITAESFVEQTISSLVKLDHGFTKENNCHVEVLMGSVD